MKHVVVVLGGCVIVGGLLIHLVYQLRSGQLLVRGWKPYAKREEDSMLYWSTIGIEAFVVLFVTCIVLLAVAGIWN